MELRTLKITDCFESPTNPRGTKFDKPEFDELVASIKEKGVLVPVLARASGKKFEVVAGNRRLRAAKEAGLTKIPAQVSELSDTEAREAQIVENLQRSDIHPLDEAAAYRDLIESSKPRMEIAAVAAKVGKSESYVRQRLVLTQLEPKIAAHVRDGSLPIAHAILVARLEKANQASAYEFTQDNDPCTLSELREHIAETVLSEAMKTPPWNDDEQAKAAIAKITGLKGGDKNLFGEDAVEKIENPADYARALAAYIQLKIDEFKTKEKSLILVSSHYSTTARGLIGTNQYDRMDQAWYGDKKCKVAQDALVVEGHGVGKLIKICTDKSCPAHHSIPKPKTPEQKATARAAKKKERDAADRRKTNDQTALVAAIGKFSWPLSEKHLDVLVGLAIGESRHDAQKEIITRRDIQLGKPDRYGGHNCERLIEKAATAMTPKEKLGLLFELLVPSYPFYDKQRSAAFKKL